MPYDGWRRGLQRLAPHCERETIGGRAAFVTGTLRAPNAPLRAMAACVRARARGVAVPVLVMTAAQDARRWAEEIAADGYLPKPFRLLDLLDAVERFVPPPAG